MRFCSFESSCDSRRMSTVRKFRPQTCQDHVLQVLRFYLRPQLHDLRNQQLLQLQVLFPQYALDYRHQAPHHQLVMLLLLLYCFLDFVELVYKLLLELEVLVQDPLDYCLVV